MAVVQDNLDRATVFDLIASHGRTDLLLHYASIIGDYSRIVAYWIQEEDWQAALLALARQVNDMLQPPCVQAADYVYSFRTTFRYTIDTPRY